MNTIYWAVIFHQSQLLLYHSYVMKTQILNNAHTLGQNNMAANVLILPGMTRQGVYIVRGDNISSYATAGREVPTTHANVGVACHMIMAENVTNDVVRVNPPHTLLWENDVR